MPKKLNIETLDEAVTYEDYRIPDIIPVESLSHHLFSLTANFSFFHLKFSGVKRTETFGAYHNDYNNYEICVIKRDEDVDQLIVVLSANSRISISNTENVFDGVTVLVKYGDVTLDSFESKNFNLLRSWLNKNESLEKLFRYKTLLPVPLSHKILNEIRKDPCKTLKVFMQVVKRNNTPTGLCLVKNLSPNGLTADVILEFRNTFNNKLIAEVAVDRNIIANQSEKFCRQFIDQFIRRQHDGFIGPMRQGKTILTVKLDDTLDIKSCLILIDYMYDDSNLQPATYRYLDCINILKAANFFEMSTVMNIILKRVFFLLNDGNFLLETYVFAYKLSIQALEDYAANLIRVKPASFYETAEWMEFCEKQQPLYEKFLRDVRSHGCNIQRFSFIDKPISSGDMQMI